jgi:ClpP class serine protease
MQLLAALSIYNRPWLIEWNYATTAMQLLQDSKYNNNPEKLSALVNIPAIAKSADVTYAPTTVWQSNNFEGYDGSNTAVLNISGPLMKNDFCGVFGTASLAAEFKKMEATKSIKNIVLLVDSPGGTVDGTEALASLIKSSKKNTTAIINGMCCSAAYWIASSCKSVLAGNKTDIIGSIGTMISFYDTTAAEAAQGYILREYTATLSTEKNAAFNEAKQGFGKKLIEQMLDPINQVFVSAVKKNRANLNQDKVLNGSTYLAADALKHGLIDGYGSLDSIIQNNLLTPKKSHKTMAFNKTIAASGSNGFEVVEGGFLATEDQLNSIENAIATLETTAENQQHEAAQSIAVLQEQVDTLTAQAATNTEALATSNNTIATLRSEVATLNSTAPVFEAPGHKGGEPEPAAALTGAKARIAEANKALANAWK